MYLNTSLDILSTFCVYFYLFKHITLIMKLFYLHLVVLSSILVWSVSGDVYMQSPRGSNNRLNENTATRNNANRVFDSQVYL